MNYSELVQLIQDYTENDETSFVNNIPTFVRQTEELVHRSVMIPELRKNATANLDTANPYMARPSDFLAPFLFCRGGRQRELYVLDRERCELHA